MSDGETSRTRAAMAVLRDAAKEHGLHFGSRMAAAISFRTVFAIAPLLVVAVSVAGFVVGGNAAAREAIVDNVREVAGGQMAELMEDLLEGALQSADTAAILGVVLLIWSASTLFIELQRDLGQIFEVPRREEKRLLWLLMQRLVGVLWTVGVGVALIALFAVNAATHAAAETLSSFLEYPEWSVRLLGSAISFAFVALMFGLVFQTLTLDRLPWRPVWVGALFTAISFSLAGFLTGLYFSTFDRPSALGYTGSIVVLLFVAYLMSTVFLFGAQVTQSYRELIWDPRHGGDAPTVDAERRGEPVAAPLTAVAAFLIGLVIGRRRRP